MVVRCRAGGNGDGPALPLPLFNDLVYDSVDASSVNVLILQALVVGSEEVSWSESRWLGINLSVGVSRVGDELSGHSSFLRLVPMSPESSLVRSLQSWVVSHFVGEEVLWPQVFKLFHHCAGQWEPLGTGYAMLLKLICSHQVHFSMPDMSSQVLINFLVYTSQSFCVLNRDTRSGELIMMHESQFCSGVFFS